MVRKEFLVDFSYYDLQQYIVGTLVRAFENINYTSKIIFSKNHSL